MKGSQQTVAGAIAVSEEDIVGQVKKKNPNKQTNVSRLDLCKENDSQLNTFFTNHYSKKG